MVNVLVIDDDAKIRKLVRVNLETRGYKVKEAGDGKLAISLMQQELPDLVLVDLVMPDIGGIAVCEWVRERSDKLPIIVLSAHSEEDLKVTALDKGADDYVTKPFGSEELLARVRAVMRRAGDVVELPVPDNTRIEVEALMIDLKARRVFVEDADVHLTRTEFALLAELARNMDAVLSHDELLARVWGPEYRGSSHYLHVYFGRIRSKIGDKHSPLLQTIPGLGYILHSVIPASS